MSPDAVDAAVVGGGAAGVATAIFAARRAPGTRIVVLDGARRLGAKILVSGGGRCNVTNRDVGPADYWGGPRRVIASVLSAFPSARAAAFFEELGVRLHEEERGKLFPDSNRARSVLDALLHELARLDVSILTGHQVASVSPHGGRWLVESGAGSWLCRRAVMATGGLSLPKSGSDGTGLAIAARLGHTVVQPSPALVPLILDGGFHRPLSGVSHEAALAVRCDGKTVARVQGPLLWTHFGISGPAALDASRHWLRVVAEGRPASALLSFVPSMGFDHVDAELVAAARCGRGGSLRSVLSAWLPGAVAEAMLQALALDAASSPAHLARDDRRRLAHALTEWELQVTGSKGYNHAEATAGGVALPEIEPRTMESRRTRGLHLVGEMLDVDGRLGGFNFQWAWSSAWVAGQAVGEAIAAERTGN